MIPKGGGGGESFSRKIQKKILEPRLYNSHNSSECTLRPGVPLRPGVLDQPKYIDKDLGLHNIKIGGTSEYHEAT